MGIREACRIYGVPKTTVHDRLSGKVAVNKMPKVGPDPVLGREGEEKLKKWVLDMAKCGFPINKKELFESVSKIIRDTGMKNPFKDGIPGDTWYQSFLRRHPEISVREAEGINNARAAVTETRVRLWFKDLREYIQSIDALDIFEDPDRIFNGDETGFSLCPKSGKILGPRGYKNLYMIKKSNEKENVTVLVVFTASGKICPPLVVFPYVRPPKALIDNMPTSWVLGRSESGWMKSDVFYEYICNSYNTWLTENGIKKPVLLFIDGHKSHMTLSLSQFCEANGIILYALPANTTHMLQPADVSVFKPLKQEWKNTIRIWQAREENINQTVTKINFCKILHETFSTINLEEAIKNGFRKCGLYPLNENAVDYTKCVKDTQRKVRTSNGKSKNSVSAKDYDAASKIISLIQDDIRKHNIDTKVILAEIDEAKAKFLANRRSKSKTPRTSAASNQSISILAEEVLVEANTAITPDNLSFIDPDFAMPQTPASLSHILTAEVRTDANIYTTDSNIENISFPETGSYISLNNISLMTFNEIEISQDQNSSLTDHSVSENQCFPITVSADVHNAEKEKIVDILPVKDIHASTCNVLTDAPNPNQFKENHIIMDEIIEYEDLEASIFDVPTASQQRYGHPLTQKDPENIIIQETGQATAVNQTFTFDDAFEKHLKFPEPPALKDKIRNGPKLPSAISTSVWREFYNKKNEDKENKIKEKRRKQELRAEVKERKAKERDNKRSKTKKTLRKTTKKSVLKCSECSNDLISDVEDDSEKNIGCDECVRWFHLRCTILQNMSYLEAAQLDYTCQYCTL